jgi:hypothetical protein
MRLLARALWFAFVTCFVFAQEDSCPTTSYSTGTLEPGGTYIGIDGVTTDASEAELSETLNVFVERITDVNRLFTPSHL